MKDQQNCPFYIVTCDGVTVEGQAAESVKEETTAGIRQSGFSFIQKTIFQHTHNIHLQA